MLKVAEDTAMDLLQYITVHTLARGLQVSYGFGYTQEQ